MESEKKLVTQILWQGIWLIILLSLMDSFKIWWCVSSAKKNSLDYSNGSQTMVRVIYTLRIVFCRMKKNILLSSLGNMIISRYYMKTKLSHTKFNLTLFSIIKLFRILHIILRLIITIYDSWNSRTFFKYLFFSRLLNIFHYTVCLFHHWLPLGIVSRLSSLVY